MKTAATLGLALIVFDVVSAAPAAGQSGAAAPGGAKALFYGASGATIGSDPPSPGVAPAQPAKTGSVPAKREYMGVTYWVELREANGRHRRVTADHVFKAGDRVRLGVQSNRDGYLSLINIGSSGRATPLFPPSGQEASGAIRAGQVFEIPPRGYLRFDNNPGEEILMLVLSPTPFGGGTSPSPAGSMVAASPSAGYVTPTAVPAGLPTSGASSSPSAMSPLPAPPPLPTPGAMVQPTALPGADSPLTVSSSPPAPPLPAPGALPPMPVPGAIAQSTPLPGADSPLALPSPSGGPPLPMPGMSPSQGALPLPVPAGYSQPGDSAPPLPQPGAYPPGGSFPPQGTAQGWGGQQPGVSGGWGTPQPGAYPQAGGFGQPGAPSGWAGPQPGAPEQGAPPQKGAAEQIFESAFKLIQQAMKKGAKDLVVETEETGSQPASYAVAPVASVQGGSMITVQIKLKHR